jgi:hypothetical protein
MGLFGFDGTIVPQGTKHVGGWMLKVTIDAADRENAWQNWLRKDLASDSA